MQILAQSEISLQAMLEHQCFLTANIRFPPEIQVDTMTWGCFVDVVQCGLNVTKSIRVNHIAKHR